MSRNGIIKMYEQNSMLMFCIFISLLNLLASCQDKTVLIPVSVENFMEFVNETNYVTEAEQYGWSILQEDVYNFRTADNLSWRLPNGIDSARHGYPVTQVSYNDAIAYCEWANASLPTYDQYWKIANKDNRLVNENGLVILPLNESNIVGNVWEITMTQNSNKEIRLAGGSYLCSEHTCNGTNPKREVFVDKTTGNTHIGFSILK